MKRHTILIANRSEIATRIIATCKSRGHMTVAVYAQQDVCNPHVYKADKAYQLSGNGGSAYLNQEELIEIALIAGATAVHPGYGFLAEKADFAQKVIDAGLIWIGPTPKHMHLMADKHRARTIMQQAGVPVFPGGSINGNQQGSLRQAHTIASKIGYPIILKSALGGGGKAMKKVMSKKELAPAWESTVRESQTLFGTDLILFEKFIENGRHVEVQIAGDGENIVHLFERECSIQRRHQKIIEETPCTFISAQTRNAMLSVAVSAAQKLGYTSLGTVEFMVTPDQHFYFLEMNTRLQVEHSVTEMTTGIDLVGLQLNVAFSGTLNLRQADIIQRGHAVECRIYSEDATNNFIPSTGTIHALELPTLPFTRIDHALETGMKILPFFDPMIAKITAWGPTRNQVGSTMQEALDNFHVVGLKTNTQFLSNVLTTHDFMSGSFDTQWVERNLEIFAQSNKNSDSTLHLAAASILPSSSQPPTKNTTQRTTTNAWRMQLWT